MCVCEGERESVCVCVCGCVIMLSLSSLETFPECLELVYILSASDHAYFSICVFHNHHQYMS